MSISETWYAIKDHGTNYCNLYNLMEGKNKQQNAEDIIDTLLLIVQFPLILFVLELNGMDRDLSVSFSKMFVFTGLSSSVLMITSCRNTVTFQVTSAEIYNWTFNWPMSHVAGLT